MSPEAKKILDDLKAYTDRAYELFIAQVQKDAVADMLERMTGKRPVEANPAKKKFISIAAGGATVSFEAPTIENNAVPEDYITNTEEDMNDAGERIPVKTYADPADDPNYGMIGSSCYSTGKKGGIVTTIEEESENV